MICILNETQRSDAFAFLKKNLAGDPTTGSFSEKLIAGFMQRQDSYTWLSSQNEEGINGILLLDESYRIVFLYVGKEDRNKGYGSALLNACVNIADKSSVAKLKIHTITEITQFLENYGFESVTKRDEMEYLCGKSLLGKTVTVIVERPYGSLDLRNEGELSVNCGYIQEEITMNDTDMKNACIVGVYQPVETFTGVVIGLVYHEEDSNIHAIVARNGELIDHDKVIQEIGMVEQYYHSRIVFADTRS